MTAVLAGPDVAVGRRMPGRADSEAIFLPRVLAIADVQLVAPVSVVDALHAFYTDLLGLRPVADLGSRELVGFCGWPRSGPRVIVSLGPGPMGPFPPRRQLLLQVASLEACSAAFQEGGIPWQQSRGWTFFDRRLTVQDPAGNRVELVTYHRL